MHTIVFYENENGKSEIIEYLRLLHEGHKEDYYKIAAFLDNLAERGSGADKVVCRCPEGVIYLHGIGGMPRLLPEKDTDPWYVRVRRLLIQKSLRLFRSAPLDQPAVCVILYGQCSEAERRKDSFVILHHYSTNRISLDLPFLQMYRAVRRLRKYCKYRSEC